MAGGNASPAGVVEIRSGRGEPAITAVIVTPGGAEASRRTGLHLAAQTIAERVELVIAAPDVTRPGLDPSDVAALHSVRAVGVGPIESTGRALAAAVAAARAPIVVCAEEHSYPQPGWAEALIEAHRGPWAAVGAALENANPRSAVSWAHLFSDFGSAVAPAPAGPARQLPGHQTAYKREVLTAYGKRLPEMLEQEWVLHDDLRARGERLYLEPAARVRHLNVSRLIAALGSEYLSGRQFGASRARLRHWSLARRALYVGASPLLPLVRLKRCVGEVRRSGRTRLLWRLAPVLAAGLTANAAGQVLGYAVGPGAAARKRLPIELERYRFVTRSDRDDLEAEPLPAPAADAR